MLLRRSRRAYDLISTSVPQKPRLNKAAAAEDAGPPIGYLLRRAYHVAKGNTGALLKALDITPTQASAVMALAREGALSQAQLGRTIGMEPGNVHSLISRLKVLGQGITCHAS